MSEEYLEYKPSIETLSPIVKLPKRNKIWLGVSVLILLGNFILYALAALVSARQAGNGWGIGVLVMPLILCLPVLASYWFSPEEKDKFNIKGENHVVLSLLISVSLLNCCFGFSVYFDGLWRFWFALLAALVNFVLVVWSWLLLLDNDWAERAGIRCYAVGHQAKVVTLFCVIFLSLTGCLAIAVAIDDNFGLGQSRALLGPGDDPAAIEQAATPAKAMPLLCGASVSELADSDQQASMQPISALHFQFENSKTLFDGVGENAKNMQQLLKDLQALSGCHAIRIRLQSYPSVSGNSNVNDAFLGQSRMKEIQARLFQALHSERQDEANLPELRFIEVSRSQRDGSVDASGRATANNSIEGDSTREKNIQAIVKLDLQPIAWAGREQPRPLLDYLYFMIYTITTTGYGDFQPNSPSTKFITSMANLIEVFFMVVFFNVLLNVSRGRGKAFAQLPTDQIEEIDLISEKSR